MKKFGFTRFLQLAALVAGLTPHIWAATINVPGDQATLAAAIAAAGDGDEIVLAAGTHTGTTIDAATDLTLTIRGATGTRSDVTITSNTVNASCLIVLNTTGSLTLNIEDLSIISTAASGDQSALRIGQHTTNTMTVNLDNVWVEHTRIGGNGAVGFTGTAAGTHGAASTFNAVDSFFRNANGVTATAGESGTITTRNGTDTNVGTGSPAANHSNQTINLTDCEVYNGPTGNSLSQDVLGAINLDTGGTGAGQATIDLTLNINASYLEGWGLNRGVITHGRSGNTRSDHLVMNIVDSTVKSYGDRAIDFVKNTPANPGNWDITLNRSLFDTHDVTSPTQTNGSKGRTVVIACTDNPGTSTLKMFNNVFLSPTDTSSDFSTGGNHKRALNAEGNMELRAYHNTVVARPSDTQSGFAANLTGVGNAGFWINNGTAATQKVRAELVNNTFYNYKIPITGASSATTNTTAIVILDGAVNSRNLIVGPYDDENDGGANRIFVSVAAPVLGVDELDTSHIPLVGSQAVDNADPSSAVSTAIGRLDHNGIDRDTIATYDIGAFETNPVPVELGEFSLE